MTYNDIQNTIDAVLASFKDPLTWVILVSVTIVLCGVYTLFKQDLYEHRYNKLKAEYNSSDEGDSN